VYANCLAEGATQGNIACTRNVKRHLNAIINIFAKNQLKKIIKK
jgi:hypothetical protein